MLSPATMSFTCGLSPFRICGVSAQKSSTENSVPAPLTISVSGWRRKWRRREECVNLGTNTYWYYWYCSAQVFVSCSWCCWKWLCSWVSRSMSMWSSKASLSHQKTKRMRVNWPFSFSIPSLIPHVPYRLIEIPLGHAALPHYKLHILCLEAVPQFPTL